MIRYLLDTNIISAATKPAPPPNLIAWMLDHDDQNLFISSISIAEVWRGVLELPPGKKRKQLERWFDGPEGPPALFAGRVLPFDERAGLIWGRLMAVGTTQGKPRSAFDMLIAAVAEAHDCVVVTADDKHFGDLETVNPLRATS